MNTTTGYASPRRRARRALIAHMPSAGDRWRRPRCPRIAAACTPLPAMMKLFTIESHLPATGATAVPRDGVVLVKKAAVSCGGAIPVRNQ